MSLSLSLSVSFSLFLSLSLLIESDSVTVDKNVAKKCNVYYESYYTPPNHGTMTAKTKKVYCYISPKQIQVKEFILLGFIPKRIYSCKVCPSTRVSLSCSPLYAYMYITCTCKSVLYFELLLAIKFFPEF